jgi:hypothetical protein
MGLIKKGKKFFFRVGVEKMAKTKMVGVFTFLPSL